MSIDTVCQMGDCSPRSDIIRGSPKLWSNAPLVSSLELITQNEHFFKKLWKILLMESKVEEVTPVLQF